MSGWKGCKGGRNGVGVLAVWKVVCERRGVECALQAAL